MPDHSNLLPNAKQLSKDRFESKKWSGYYAGYSREFVKAAIAELGLTKRSLVLDPWSGSGTTGCVAQEVGITSLNIEINPITALVAAGRFARELADSNTIKIAIQKLKTITNEIQDCTTQIISGTEVIKKFPTYSEYPYQNSIAILPIDGLVISSVLISFKSIKKFERTKNPTWTKRMENGIEKDALSAAIEKEIDELKKLSISKPKTDTRAIQIIGDSRTNFIQSKSIDAIITSPPYLTRIDYARSTADELEWLLGSDILRIEREKNMGAPVVRQSQSPAVWMRNCLLDDIASRIFNHDSYAAKSYYFKFYQQYFNDMHHCISSIHRALKNNGIALLVIQNSYFKDIEIPLGEIYLDYWIRFFGSGEIVARHTSKNSIVNINRRATTSKIVKPLYEETIALYK